VNKTTKIAHLATVGLMAVAVLVATGDGFAQSYAGLLRWATEHHLHDWRADSFPLLVDLFILVGELGLFALALEGHRISRRLLSWTDLALPGGIAAAGWTVSLLFNIGAAHKQCTDQVTAAVPPVAAMLGLLVLLRTLHRLVKTVAPTVAHSTDTVPALPAGPDPLVENARETFRDVLATGTVPSVRAIRRELHLGHPKAVAVRTALAESP
jgi:Protein of unknown function (DUF2637)